MAKKILVADDETKVLDYTRRILEAKGYQVTTVPSGEAALDELRTNHYDFLLTDCVMISLDGMGLISIVKGWNKNRAKEFFEEDLEGYQEFANKYDGLPMILMSKDLHLTSLETVKEAGGVDIIKKSRHFPPLDKDELVEKIQKYLSE